MNDRICPMTKAEKSIGEISALSSYSCNTDGCAWWISEVGACAVTVMARNMIINVKMLEQDLFAGEFDEIDEEDPF